jgi:hypothetical protein
MRNSSFIIPHSSLPSLESKAAAILEGANKAINHAAVVTGGIEVRDPAEIERIGLAPQVTEVLHHHKSLVVVLVVNLRALCDLSLEKLSFT